MDTNKILSFIKSKKVAVLMVVLFCLAVLVGTFSVGVAVGYRKIEGEKILWELMGPSGRLSRSKIPNWR